MKRRSLYFLGPYQVALREEEAASPGPGQLLVQTLVSAISPGTELLIYRGQAPQHLAADLSLPALSGSLAFPLTYGYAAVGRVVEAGPAVAPGWPGTLVFAFHPHADRFAASPDELHPVPPDLTPEEAVFLANMETAVTLGLDGRPLLGEQVVVFGQGVVGLLLTAILARFPLAALVTLDRFPNRRLASETLGAHTSLDPDQPGVAQRLADLLQGGRPYCGADLAYEVSGQPAALNLALGVLGFHGRLVIGSWYGKNPAHLHLGGDFHRRRQHLFSSQVSTISPELSGRWRKSRVLAQAWRLLRDLRPARLITHRVPFAQAPEAYRLLDQHPQEAIQVVLTY
jgi:2-desacetyl-2-hydroxyethyl bacteriochlorophyllide A dehydrogenase